MSRKKLQSFSGLLSLALALLTAAPAVIAADGVVLPIKKIAVDSSQHLMVEFGSGSFPSTPQLLDLPGPNHRMIVDFVDASIDRSSLLSQQDLSKAICQLLPFVKIVRYSDLEHVAKPTARLVIDLPEDVKIQPRVVKLEEGMAVIAFSDKPIVMAAPVAPAAIAAVASAEPTLRAPVDTGANKPPVRSAAVAESTQTPSPELRDTNETAAEPEKTATVETPSAAATQPEGKKVEATVANGGKQEAVKLYNKAVQLHLSGKLPDAIGVYKEALQADSGLAEAHSNLGLIFNQQHNYAEALTEFRKALAINPRDAITYNGIGAALRAEKDLLGAVKNWQTAVSLDPKLATAHYNLGTAYEIQKEYDKALASYRSAVKNDYRLGEAYYRMGLIMERKHRSEEAAEQFKEALKVSGESEYSEDARQRLAYLQQNKKTGKE